MLSISVDPLIFIVFSWENCTFCLKLVSISGDQLIFIVFVGTLHVLAGADNVFSKTGDPLIFGVLGTKTPCFV